MPGKQELIAFPVYPGVTPLDLVGPLMVLQTRGSRTGTEPSWSASTPSDW